jgi:hypothetical protein
MDLNVVLKLEMDRLFYAQISYELSLLLVLC